MIVLDLLSRRTRLLQTHAGRALLSLLPQRGIVVLDFFTVWVCYCILQKFFPEHRTWGVGEKGMVIPYERIVDLRHKRTLIIFAVYSYDI